MWYDMIDARHVDGQTEPRKGDDTMRKSDLDSIASMIIVTIYIIGLIPMMAIICAIMGIQI